MARIVYTIGEIKGSIAGLTFQQNSSGKIVRARPQVRRTSTTKQQTAHQTQQNLLQQYQALTNTEKDLWNLYGKTFPKTNKYGQNKTLTGQNWFESINYQRLISALGSLAAPPAHVLPRS